MAQQKILFIGGGGPTGPLIVDGLLAQGHAVTVMNSGRRPAAFAGEVERLVADPNFFEQVRDATAGRSFDVAVAQYGRLRHVARALTGRVEHLIGIGGMFYPHWIDPAAATRPTSEGGAGGRDWAPTYLDEAVPMPESTPLMPVGTFGARVVEADTTLQWLHQHGAFATTMLRYPRVYGPRQPGAVEWSIVRRILDGRRRIILPEGGFLVQSILYAENAARIVLAVIHDRAKSAGQVYNCADAEPVSHRKWVRLIAESMGRDVEIVSAPSAMARASWPYARFPVTTGHHVLDTRKVQQLGVDLAPVGFGIRRTVEWILEDVDARGYKTEGQLRDPFRYDLEDAVIALLDRTQVDIEGLDFPDLDMAHAYAHPAAAAGEGGGKNGAPAGNPSPL